MMDSSTITLIWLIAGILLACSEFLVPGFVIIFTGLSAMLVALVRFLFGLESLPICFALWLTLSITLFFTAGKFLRKHVQGDKTISPDVSEQELAFGKVAELTAPIAAGAGQEGRIRFQGTTWKARSLKGEAIPAGTKVRLLDKDNLCWVVEPDVVIPQALPVSTPAAQGAAAPQQVSAPLKQQ